SHKRVEENSYFDMIKDEAALIKRTREESRLPLSLEKEFLIRRDINKEIDRVDEAYEKMKNDSYTVLRSASMSRSGNSTEELYEEWLKDVEKDAYIIESFGIVKDMAESH
ncbi:MAG TPA: carboxy terminal-processing peptidase, partial [Candidatus Mcinerneyibacteriales bacterium]|nr:carboxy terminal-processing peptidase [Candidatus Mcinerneyibacteriales bacterium]